MNRGGNGRKEVWVEHGLDWNRTSSGPISCLFTVESAQVCLARCWAGILDAEKGIGGDFFFGVSCARAAAVVPTGQMAASSISARDNQTGINLVSPPSTRSGAARVFDVPLVRATAENLRGFGRPVRDFSTDKVDIVPWPAAGWRALVPGTGDEGGVVEDVFRNELDASGRVQLSVNVGLNRRYIIGWFGDDPAEAAHASAAAAAAPGAAAAGTIAATPGAAAAGTAAAVDRSFILTHEANYHPDGGQIIASRDGAPVVLLLAPKGDDVSAASFRAFFVDPAFDGTVGVHIDAGTWHQPAFPVHEGAGAGGASPTLDNRQGKVHACVACDFVREFGGYLRVPLTRAAILEGPPPPVASPVAPRLGFAILYVADVARSSAFYAAAFGLRAGLAVGEPPAYCELQTGATKLALCAVGLAASNFSDPSFFTPASRAAPAQASEVGIVVADVPAAFARAVAAGAVAAAEPKTKPWGQIVSYVRDLDGHLVEICS